MRVKNLPKEGYCKCMKPRVNNQQISNRRRKRNNQNVIQTIPSLPSSQPFLLKPTLAFLIFENETVLCQILPKTTTRTSSAPQLFCLGDIVCYDSSTKIHIAQQESPSKKPAFSARKKSLVPNWFPVGSTCAYKVKSIDEDQTKNAVQIIGDEEPSDDANKSTVEKQEVIQKASDMTPLLGKSSQPPLLMLAEAYPIPLLSLTLQVHVVNNRDDYIDHGDPLQQAHRKRRLVGKVIILAHNKDGSISATTKLSDGQDCGGVSYEVASATGTPTIIGDREFTTRDFSTCCYKVVPSTLITFIYAENKVSENHERTPSSIVSSSSTSPVADLLCQTIQCIQNNIPVPQTFMLSGPPGVGKTYSIKLAITKRRYKNKVHLVSIRGSELLQESNPAYALQNIFTKAATSTGTKKKNKDSTKTTTVLLFLDECDALVSSDSVSAMLATMLDQISTSSSTTTAHYDYSNIIVVGATNRIDSIPQYLRRSGRFDREIPLSPPNSTERAKILYTLLFKKKPPTCGETTTSEEALNENNKHDGLEGETWRKLYIRITSIAEDCVGYVPADLTALVRRATVLAMSSYSMPPTPESQTAANLTNSIVDYLPAAMKDVGASALRDATLTAPPKVSWDDIAGDPGGAKTALRQAIEWPRIKAKAFRALDLHPPRGILLHGPPGCAKTSLARAAAGASSVAFLSLSPAQVYSSSYVGEAEAVVRRVFTLARSAAPCILFFDEIDSIFGNNEDDTGRGSSAEARVLSTFLNEMDGIDIGRGGVGGDDNVRNGVLVLGATNRPWTLDAALLRPGRLGDKVIYVPAPEKEARRSILEKHFGDAGMDLDYLASDRLSGLFTGAELVGACQEAKLKLLRDVLNMEEAKQEGHETVSPPSMKQEYLEQALASTKPLLSDPVALQEFRLFGMQH